MKRQLVLTALFGLLLASCDGFLASSQGSSSLPEGGGSALSSLSSESSSAPAEPVLATCRITFGTVSDNTVSTIVG